MIPSNTALLHAAVEAARRAGTPQRNRFERAQRVTEVTAHDIKLEMDVSSQRVISLVLLGRFPGHAILGEEGNEGSADASFRWVVDPLDGTANYAFGVPVFAVSIAGQKRVAGGNWQN